MDRFSLRGQRVLVTGASRGLGQALALAAVEAGADVIGTARSGEGLRDTLSRAAVHPGRFEPLAIDLSGDVNVDHLVSTIWKDGAISGIVHAAGIQVRRPAIDVTREDFERVAERIHLEAPFLLTTAIARRQLALAMPGSHVFIGSLTSWIGIPNISPYAASKSGIFR